MDMKEGLNPEQARALDVTTGPLLILAGAGSGKTKTLTHRIAHLIANEAIWPNEILAVTFTNKAAKEMRQRLSTLLGQPNTRGFMRWMGTFHGICVRILRQDGDKIGLRSNFVIYDEDDRQGLIKQTMKELSISSDQIKPRAVSAAISNAKNDLIDPEAYALNARYPNQQAIARIYAHYERLRDAAAALDFDDLLMETVRLLRDVPETRARYRTQFKHILIDEYQDTNAAQYAIVKYLVNKQQNICVVGDDWQCFPEGSRVDTPDGPVAIETLRRGDKVLSAAGYGKATNGVITRVRKVPFGGQLVRATTANGRVIECTPKHIVFGRFTANEKFYVYLMYSPDKGYRIGMAKGTRFDGKRHSTGLRVRANQERAARMWVLRVCDSRADAQFHEGRLSFLYGIPMTVFHAYTNRNMSMTQQHIDTLYADIDTRERAKALMADEQLSFDYPHFVPSGTTRGGQQHSVVNVVLFGDKRQTARTSWSASRISLQTSDPAVSNSLQQQGIAVRAGKGESLRAEWHSTDYGVVEERVAAMAIPGGSTVMRYTFMTDKKFVFMPASHLREGMSVPVLQDGRIIEDTVVTLDRVPYKGTAYDLDIDKVHNYSVNGIVSHNSIYSWRGADFKNILNFERDFPGAVVIKLEQNYRSTEAILEAAHNVITKNIERTDKQLWTEVGKGMPVEVEAVRDEAEEALVVASRVSAQVAIGARRYDDFAVLYRTNAQSFAFERAFLQHRIPYHIVGGVRFYDRKEIKDIIAYLRLAYQPQDRMSFSRIVNVPTRGIGATSFEKFITWQAGTGMDIISALVNAEQTSSLTPRARQAFAQLGELFRSLQALIESGAGPSDIIDRLIELTGYRNYILDGTPQAEDREANLGVLVSDAGVFASLSDFLEEVALMSSADANMNEPSVTLMTLHAAKGLEFPVVFMAGMEDGLFPSSRALEEGPAHLEEERRLCYVGMTRAREELHLSYAQSRAQFGQRSYGAPSRFLSDMGYELAQRQAHVFRPQFGAQSTDFDDYVMEYEVGDQVRSAQFGIGEIIDVDGLAVTVEFATGTRKKLNVQFARLEKL